MTRSDITTSSQSPNPVPVSIRLDGSFSDASVADIMTDLRISTDWGLVGFVVVLGFADCGRGGGAPLLDTTGRGGGVELIGRGGGAVVEGTEP